jgi:hypothetical protein
MAKGKAQTEQNQNRVRRNVHTKKTKEQKKTRLQAEKQSIEQVRQKRGQDVEEDTALRTGENTIEGVSGCVGVEYVGIFVKFHYISSNPLPQLFQLPPPFQCAKLLPYAGIFLLFLTLLFCLYVNSVPPSIPSITPDPADYSLEELRDVAKGDDRLMELVEKYAVQSGREGGLGEEGLGNTEGEEEGETEEL